MRVKSPRRQRHNKYLKLAAGYHGARHRWYRKAKEAVVKAGQYAFAGRKLRKRDLRSTWISRINSQLKAHGLQYSKFMAGLKNAKIDLNRQVLSELATNQPEVFLEIAKTAGFKVDKVQA